MNFYFGKRHPQPALKQRRFNLYAAVTSLLLIFWLPPLPAQEEVVRYTMAPGDNPWNITERFLHSFAYWKPMLRLNRIDRPRQLPPGTELNIPLSWLKTEAAKARVRAVSGDASYSSAKDNQSKPLLTGTLLESGDRISIGTPGNAVLEYADGSTLFLSHNTQVTLKQLKKFSNSGLADTEVDLKSGRTENRVKTRGTRFEINTPSASTAVRGTDFRTSVDREDGKLSRIEVLSGAVAVDGAGSSRGISAGFGTTVLQGQPPALPLPLLKAPKFAAPIEYSRAFPVEIRWLAVEGAKQYRLQVKAQGGYIPLLDEVTTRTSLSTDTLQDGRFTMRVRAIDSAGLEGRERTSEFLLDAQPQPPLAVTPQLEQIVRTPLPTFEWTRPLGAAKARFQLVKEKQNTPLIDIQDYPENHFTPDTLQPGTYAWRLAAQNDDEQGPFGEYQVFTLKPAPGKPQVANEGDDQHIRLRWPTAGDGRRYRVQISESSDFQAVAKEQIVEESVWEANRPTMPSYFRVQTIDTDGYEGAWSTPQMIDPAPRSWYQILLPSALLLLLAL